MHSNMRFIKCSLFIFILLPLVIIAQEHFNPSYTDSKVKKLSEEQRIYADTDIIYSFDLLTDRDPLGVTIVDGVVIVSSSGNGNNYFDRYSLDGTYINSFDQQTVSDWGYRDLAFDGNYILASDDNNIQKISPNDFTIVSSIFNDSHSPHRGLAYNPDDDIIYSTNFRSGQLTLINAQTGVTISENGRPEVAPYGIAYDKYSNSNAPMLWYAEPSQYGAFRISRVDINTAKVNYTYDVTAKTENPDSALTGGLEIINDHPDYPDKVIAVAVEQNSQKLLFIDITDAPNPLPFELEEVGEFGGFDEEGIITSGMAVYDDYLYCVNNNDVSIYEISGDPTSPFFIKSLGLSNLNKIFIYDDHMYLTHGENFTVSIVSIYSLADPINPQFMSSFDTQDRIRQIISHNDYIIIAKSNAGNIDILDISDKSVPVLIQSYPLPADAVSLASDETRDILFAGFYGGGVNAGVKVLDVSDINNVAELDELNVLGEVPQSMFVYNNYLYLMRTWAGFDATSLGVYDYTDASAVDRLAFKFLSLSNGGWQIKNVNNYVAATLPAEGMFTYYFDEQAQLLLSGPSIQLPESREIVSYNFQTNSAKSLSTMEEPSSVTYTYTSNGFANQDEVAGSKRNKVVKQKAPPPPPAQGQVRLTLGIEPPQAEQEGCLTDPSGFADYDINETANIKAIPNTDEGWNFTHWTGDASGNSAETTVFMDADKIAIAHFVKPELNITTSGPEGEVYCPDEAHETQIKIMDIVFKTNSIDDWSLSFIEIKRLDGDSHAKKTLLNTPNGQLEAEISFPFDPKFHFNPPLIIPKNSTITLSLVLDIFIDEEDERICELKQPFFYQYGIATGSDVTVIPLNYSYGKKTISTPLNSNRFYIACVEDSEGVGYAKINHALRRTPDIENDVIYVCKGEYEEDLQIREPVTIISKNGKDETKILPPFQDYYSNRSIFKGVDISSSDVIINGFTIDFQRDFRVVDDPRLAAIAFSKQDEIVLSNITIQECVIQTKSENVPSMLGSANNSTFSSNTFLSFLEINDSEELTLKDNIFFTAKGNRMSNCNSSTFEMNRCYTDFELNLFNFNNGFIRNNQSLGSVGKFALTSSEDNTIHDNKNFAVTLDYSSDWNEVFQNELNKVNISSSSYNKIDNNEIINPTENGIVIQPTSSYGYQNESTKGNKIVGNTITGAAGYGIYVSNSTDGIIKENTVKRAKKYGIRIDDSIGPVVKKNVLSYNKIGGLLVFGSIKPKITENRIFKHESKDSDGSGGYGLYLYESYKGYVASNRIVKNCTGIQLYSSNTKIHINTIYDSFCLNTGIHLTDSDVDIFGNRIQNNNGNGILIDGNGRAVINSNNISGNTGFDVNNSSENSSVDASLNYWGTSEGPTEENINGNMVVSSWLEDPVDLVSTLGIDTLYILPGQTDSVIINVLNANDFTDRIELSVNDSENWLTNGDDLIVDYSDTLGSTAELVFSIPADESSMSISTVVFNGSSVNNTELVISDTFYVASYEPYISRFIIGPDSASVQQNDSLFLYYECIDQFDNEVNIELKWEASTGHISNDGWYHPDSTQGEVMITASNAENNLNDQILIFVASDSLYLADIVIRPDSITLDPREVVQFEATGFNQHLFPMNFTEIWECNGGIIDDKGLFTADTIPGFYSVLVSDTLSGLVAFAHIEITLVTSNNEARFIPHSYFLNNNYPNPFNPSTTISYGLPFESRVRLEVFNVLGQRVDVLVNSIQKAGLYKYTWNAGNLASGLYLITLNAESYKNRKVFNTVRKMLLIK